MKWKNRYGLCAIGAMAFVLATIVTASALPFDVSEDFSFFGQQQNLFCPGPGSGSVCAATAAINSFAFLQNKFPVVYDKNLLPNYDPLTKTDRIDAIVFAIGNWPEPAFLHPDDTPMADLDIGYYARAPGLGFDANRSYLETKMDWISDHVPEGRTTFASFLTPTIAQLAGEMQAQEGVEFFVKDTATNGTAFYNALTLTRVMCDVNNNCSIQYQDPNDPSVQQPLTPVTVVGGRLQFTGVPGSGFAGTVFIDAAFAESVPEPSSLLLLGFGLGIAGLTWRRYRDK